MAIEFQVGDRVKSLYCSTLGEEGTIIKIKDGSYFVKGLNKIGASEFYDDAPLYSKCYLELIESHDSQKANMLQPLTDLSNLIQRSFNEQTKTLYRAGYLTKDLNITDKLTKAIGEMFVGHIIDNTIASSTIESFAKELIARANDEIAEAEKADSK